jgi:hypothetical protein
MQENMRAAQAKLAKLLEGHEPTVGLYVRVHGDNLILGREEPTGPSGELANSDRVRVTLLDAATYGLSAKLHTGRWERTPFAGTMEEMVDALTGCMQHLVAPD